MARTKGLQFHPIKEGVFSFTTKGNATDVQIFGTPVHHYIKTMHDCGYMTFNTGTIAEGVYLVLKNADIFGILPTYQVTEYNDRVMPITRYNIYKQN